MYGCVSHEYFNDFCALMANHLDNKYTFVNKHQITIDLIYMILLLLLKTKQKTLEDNKKKQFEWHRDQHVAHSLHLYMTILKAVNRRRGGLGAADNLETKLNSDKVYGTKVTNGNNTQMQNKNTFKYSYCCGGFVTAE